MYFDTHAHYDDKRFNDDRAELLASMREHGITRILNAGSSMRSSEFGIKLAGEYDFIYAAAGVHPHDAKEMTDGSLDRLEKLLRHPKAVAVGEIGLDYHYDFSPRDVQKLRFRDQLELARRVNKPVIIHEREAVSDTLEILADYKDLTCVVHCFSGSWETAQIILGMGWYLSFTGVITFKNARKALEVIAKMPLDRIMLETDAPYLAPEPMRGKRNSSIYLPHIAQKVAEVRAMPVEDVAKITTDNALEFFGIK